MPVPLIPIAMAGLRAAVPAIMRMGASALGRGAASTAAKTATTGGIRGVAGKAMNVANMMPNMPSMPHVPSSLDGITSDGWRAAAGNVMSQFRQ